MTKAKNIIFFETGMKMKYLLYKHLTPDATINIFLITNNPPFILINAEELVLDSQDEFSREDCDIRIYSLPLPT